MRYVELALAIFLAGGAQAGELKLELHGEGINGNQIRVAVYSDHAPEQFTSDVEFYRGIVDVATSNKLIVMVAGLPSGKYAIAAYVDSNKNGKQDKNFLGMPIELYGFSNDVRGRFGPPDFVDAAFDVGENIVTRSIHLH